MQMGVVRCLMHRVKRGLCLAWISYLLLGCSAEDNRQGMVAALVHAIQESRKIQVEIAATGGCPDTLEGWRRDKSGMFLETRAGTAKVDYVLSFDCSEPDLTFGVLVKYSLDSGPWVLGSATGALTVEHGHFTDPRRLEIGSADDAAVVAAKVVRASYGP